MPGKRSNSNSSLKETGTEALKVPLSQAQVDLRYFRLSHED